MHAQIFHRIIARYGNMLPGANQLKKFSFERTRGFPGLVLSSCFLQVNFSGRGLWPGHMSVFPVSHVGAGFYIRREEGGMLKETI